MPEDASQRSEAELVEAVRGGDERAFESLCARYRGLLVARVRQWVAGAIQRKVSIQDVLQEAYVVAFERLGEFEPRGEGGFGGWLAQIAEFKAREAVRKYAGTQKRGARHEVSVGGERAEPPGVSPEPSPSEAAMGHETAQAARRALAALPDDYRHVLTLVQVNRLKLDDAAVLLNRSYEATKKLYGRALARYAEALAVERKSPRP